MENRRYIWEDGERDLNVNSLFLEINQTEKPRSNNASTLFRNRNKYQKNQVNELKELISGTSLVIQWLRICLPIQGAWVQSWVREDSTCCGATRPMCPNYWTAETHTPLSLCSATREATTVVPGYPLATTGERPSTATKTQYSQKEIINLKKSWSLRIRKLGSYLALETISCDFG